MSRPVRTPSRKRTAASKDARPGAAPQLERLQKVLAAAGLGSRRQCEELIEEGRVEIDRQVAAELGVRVDPSKQEIRVDGAPLRQSKRVYYAVHKPRGVVSTNRDPQGRARVVDLAPDGHRLFPVGRLDRMSEGLILLTNDGELANRLTHPRYGVEKTYRVVVAGHPEPVELRALQQGVRLAEGIARVQSVRVKQRRRQSTELEIVLNEGRNREIRRLLARTGHKVMQLVRIAVGPVRLGELPRGAYRALSRDEVRKLTQASAPNRRSQEKTAAKAGDSAGASGSKPRRSARPAGAAQRGARRKPTDQASSSKPRAKRKFSQRGGAAPRGDSRPAKGAKGRRK